MANKYDLNTSVRLEFILASLDVDYKEKLEMLKDSVSEYDKDIIAIIDRYIWLADNQLGGKPPSIEILKAEFNTLNFTDVRPIQDKDALADYIKMYVSSKKRVFVANTLLDMSDRIRTQGVSEEDTAKLYKYLDEPLSEEEEESILDNFQKIYEAQRDLVGISFLNNELDDLSGGITPGQVCTILGAPGSMKTTYSSNIAYNALKLGKNVLYLSLEEPTMQLYSKWLSRCSVDAGCPIPQQDILQRKMDEKQKNLLFNKVEPLLKSYPGKLFILDEQNLPDYKLITLESKFKDTDRKARELTGHGIDLLVVDHVQILKFAIPGQDTITNINYYVSFFRKQSLNWLHEHSAISVILLSQANREGYAFAQKNNGEYLSQHVAEASEVERASSYIISVYTDSMSQVTNTLTLTGVKLRNGQKPASLLQVYANGAVYQVGKSDTGTLDNNVDESHLDINSII